MLNRALGWEVPAESLEFIKANSLCPEASKNEMTLGEKPEIRPQCIIVD